MGITGSRSEVQVHGHTSIGPVQSINKSQSKHPKDQVHDLSSSLVLVVMALLRVVCCLAGLCIVVLTEEFHDPRAFASAETSITGPHKKSEILSALKSQLQKMQDEDGGRIAQLKKLRGRKRTKRSFWWWDYDYYNDYYNDYDYGYDYHAAWI